MNPTPLRRPATAAARSGLLTDDQYGAVVPPLFLSSNFTFDGLGGQRRYDYTRSGNPSRDLLAEALTELEGGDGAVVTSSGMSAVALVCQLLDTTQRVLAPHDCYGGTYRLFEQLQSRGVLQVRFVDQTDEAAVRAALATGIDLIWVETPSNPLLRIVDIEKMAALGHDHGALVAVDNTFLSPALQQPIGLGADLVVHSTTKYLNGHSDVVGGAVVAATAALRQRLDHWANCLGLSGAPFDSYLTLRGVRTLYARCRLHEENALAIVELLQGQASVAEVLHPSLPRHPGHALAQRQQSGFGAMLSFRLRGDITQVRTVVESLQCFALAESLGGVESLVAHPATMTHAAMPAAARAHAGIDDQLLRLSIGIEDKVDLLDDLAQALDRCHARPRDVAGSFSGRLRPAAGRPSPPENYSAPHSAAQPPSPAGVPR